LQRISFDSWSVEEIRAFLDKARQELRRREELGAKNSLNEEAILSSLKVSFRRFQRDKKKQLEDIESLFR